MSWWSDAILTWIPHLLVHFIYMWYFLTDISLFVMAKATFNKKKALSTSKLDLKLRNRLVKCYIWGTTLYRAETWTLREVDQKCLESFKIWCWRRMEKIIWTDCVRNAEVLQRVKEGGNILQTMKRRKAKWTGHFWRWNCFLKHVMEGNIEGRTEVTGRRGRRYKQLLIALKEIKGSWELKEEALDRTLWRTRFGRSYGPVVRQNRLCKYLSSRDLCRMLQTNLHLTLAGVKPRADLSEKHVRRIDLSHWVLSVEILEQVCEDFNL